MLPTIDDNEPLGLTVQGGHQIIVIHLATADNVYPLQQASEFSRIRREFLLRTHFKSIDEIRSGQRRLGGRANHNRSAIVAGKLVDRRNTGTEKRQWNGLSLIQDDHASREVMKFPAA